MTETDTVIVGAGHAGLAVSRLLSAGGHEHVILERGRVGERWRSERWDSLRLLTPNWMTRLPGWRYCGPDPDGYLSAGALVQFLDRYAASFDAPVVGSANVEEVSVVPRASGHRYLVVTDRGTWRTRHVVIASGPHGTPAGRLRCTRAVSSCSPRSSTATPHSCPPVVSSSSAPRPRACRSPTSSHVRAAGSCSPSAGTPGCRAATAEW